MDAILDNVEVGPRVERAHDLDFLAAVDRHTPQTGPAVPFRCTSLCTNSPKRRSRSRRQIQVAKTPREWRESGRGIIEQNGANSGKTSSTLETLKPATGAGFSVF